MERTLSYAEVRAFTRAAPQRKYIAKCGDTGECLLTEAFAAKYPDVREAWTTNGNTFNAGEDDITKYVRIHWIEPDGQDGALYLSGTEEADKLFEVIQTFDRSGYFGQGKTGRQICKLFGW